MALSNEPAKVPRCEPASAPCATIAVTPLASNIFPSSTVVAVPKIAILAALRRAIA